ncbi:polysaccharide biosynthesis C-terminal domain-containing protein [Rhodoferax sp.]|uniref:oligosaccharide flippase family protein n=1 Tax=Rhodoferax sp. TaxID=50421 RepID=UPI002637ABB4|nr:polysaccharide biosynthesis C-terminal domain-containing protein [Rhodoferax sp.]MDD3934905.1 polysaccharide biosynthesis C-terminal domain-containing protein [Rhodoferax sp.]
MALLWVGLLGGAGFAFLTQLLLVRTVPIADMGAMAGVLSLTLLAMPAAEFGIAALWLRIFAKYRQSAFCWIKPTLRIFVLTSTATLLLLLLIGHNAWNDQHQRQLLYWLLPLPVMEALVVIAGARLQLEGRYRILAVWRALPKFTRLAVVIGAWVLGADISTIAIGYCLTSLLVLVLALSQLASMMNGSAKLELPAATPVQAISTPTSRGVLAQAWPFAMGNIFSLIYLQSDIFMLSAMHDTESTALYNVAFSIIALVYLLPTAIFNQFLLPRYHRWAEYDHDKLLRAYRLGNGAMIVIGLVVMLSLIAIAPFLVEFFFGATYSAAGYVVQTLALCVPFRYLASSIGNCLVTQDHMRKKMTYQMTVAVLNVGLNLILIPNYGMHGAAWATVLSELALCLLYLMGVKNHIFGSQALRGWTLNYRTMLR